MAKVYVGNLPNEVRESVLEDRFSRYGKIQQINLKFPPRPPAFAFIEFSDSRDADDAVRGENGREFDGSKLRVELAQGRSGGRGDYQDRSSFNRRGGGGRRTDYRVLLSNLAPSVSWQDLKDFLRREGDVVHADVDRNGGGTAEFSSSDDVHNVIDRLDDVEFRGQRVKISKDSKKGRSRSRSPRRHRSPPRRSYRSRSPRRRSPRRRSPPRRRSRTRSRSRSVEQDKRRSSISKSRSPSRSPMEVSPKRQNAGEGRNDSGSPRKMSPPPEAERSP